MTNVNVKIAYGEARLGISMDPAWTLSQFVRKLKTIVKTHFVIEDGAAIEIVIDRGLPYSELRDKVPETPRPIGDYIFGEGLELKCNFYVRIILSENNEEYLKIYDSNRNAEYIKKQELEEVRSGVRQQCEVMRLRSIAAPEICSICYENNVHNLCVYRCSHLFCRQCSGTWSSNCALCREGSL